jgi:hypothetical protein
MAFRIGHRRKIFVMLGRPDPLQIALFLMILATFAIATTVGLRGFGDKASFIGLGAFTALMVIVLVLSFVRGWTVSIDPKTKRLRIVRELFGHWRKTIVDCSFDECEALGVRRSTIDGLFTCSVYVQLKSGMQHDILVARNAHEEAARVADELTNATGIPRLDIPK